MTYLKALPQLLIVWLGLYGLLANLMISALLSVGPLLMWWLFD